MARERGDTKKMPEQFTNYSKAENLQAVTKAA